MAKKKAKAASKKAAKKTAKRENKIKATNADVDAFLAAIEDERRREDCERIAKMMRRVTKEPPRMWGSSMVGFGSYHYRYESGHEGDTFLTGFSPRKGNLTVYILAGFSERPELMERLGPHKTGKSCLYLKSLDGIDMKALEDLVRYSVDFVKTCGLGG